MEQGWPGLPRLLDLKSERGFAGMNYFDYEYRVIYHDTDKMGISYYANYFVWFEAARTEYFRALGFPYTECERKGWYLPVVKAEASYLAPSRYDDLLTIRTSVGEFGKSSLRFDYQVFKKQNPGDAVAPRLLTTGFTLHVFVDASLRPVRIPDEIRKKVQPFPLSATDRLSRAQRTKK